MLVLTRKVDESIIIDDKTRIKILTIRANQVRLGIEAPNRISVVREELLDAGRMPADLAQQNPYPPGNAGNPSTDEDAGYPSG